MKTVIIAILLLLCQAARAQLFDNPDNMKLVQRGIYHIYNVQEDSANIYIEKIAARLPKHPAIPMMRALNVLWANIPLVTIDSVFKTFSGHLRESIRLSALLDGGRQTHPEAIFFEMSARGLLAEYYADDGHYMKALSEAGKAYDLVKKGFELSEEVPEFLLTTGVYNYFREKYPEKYPVYKPLLWFFRSGDVDLGLRQIELATKKAVLTNVEAHVYMAYIYLRYEYEPRKAQSYLWKLTREYPRNLYIKSKLLESLTPGDDFANAPKGYIRELVASDRPYYQMAGLVFRGLHYEKVELDPQAAIMQYKKGISVGQSIMGHGTLYRSMAYLGLGRIYHKLDKKEDARYHLEKVVEISESEALVEQAEALLDELD